MKNIISNFQIITTEKHHSTEGLKVVHIKFEYRNNSYNGTLYHLRNDIVTLTKMVKEGGKNRSPLTTMDKVRGAIQVHYREQLN